MQTSIRMGSFHLWMDTGNVSFATKTKIEDRTENLRCSISANDDEDRRTVIFEWKNE